MTSFILAGGMGAVLNCALASYFSSSLDYVLQLLLGVLVPYSTLQTLRTIVPVLFGFFGGTLLLLTWHFLKTRVVRFLLAYDGWFLHPKRPIVKVYYNKRVYVVIVLVCLKLLMHSPHLTLFLSVVRVDSRFNISLTGHHISTSQPQLSLLNK